MKRFGRLTGVLGLGALLPFGLVFGMSATTVSSAVSAAATNAIVPLETVGPVVGTSVESPPTAAECLSAYGIGCYDPAQMAAQYNFPTSGPNGAGQTIVIFDSFGSPTIQSDLATFDAAYNLPAPPSFHIYNPEGTVQLNYTGLPSPVDFHNRNVDTEIGWAYETTLDVEWAHAMAPGANIALVVVPVPETQGVQGLQNLENAQQWALDNHIGNIWSNSYATTEQAFNTSSSIQSLNKLYARAAVDGVTALFAAGDSGVQNANLQGVVYPYPTVNYPSSSPNVLSVGGTEIPSTPPDITSYVPEQVWHDPYGAGGGGYSSVFGETSAQIAAGVPDPSGMRGIPDVSYNAAVISAVLIYESFDPIGGAGWVPIGGTSAATPQWAAVTALVDQADGPQGFLAPKLYGILQNPSEYIQAFHDITVGNNSWGGITGYSAAPGWDAASGLGTPNVANLISVLHS